MLEPPISLIYMVDFHDLDNIPKSSLIHKSAGTIILRSGIDLKTPISSMLQCVKPKLPRTNPDARPTSNTFDFMYPKFILICSQHLRVWNGAKVVVSLYNPHLPYQLQHLLNFVQKYNVNKFF